MIDLSIVLPCYNEGETLSQLVDEYRETFKDVDNVELILIDNGSVDSTAEQLKKEVTKENPFVLKIVTVNENQGYGHGIMTGLSEATGTYLAWSHSDLQCSPQDVVNLYRKVLEQPNPENCFGKGYRTNKIGRTAIMTRLQTYLSFLILGHYLTEINAQPKLFHRNFIKDFNSPPLGYELDYYAVYKAVLNNWDMVVINVIFHDRQAGESKWSSSLRSKLIFIINNLIYLLKLRLFRKTL